MCYQLEFFYRYHRSKKNWAHSQLAGLNSSSLKFSVPMEMIVVSDCARCLSNSYQLEIVDKSATQSSKQLGATECCDSYSSEPWYCSGGIQSHRYCHRKIVERISHPFLSYRNIIMRINLMASSSQNFNVRQDHQ